MRQSCDLLAALICFHFCTYSLPLPYNYIPLYHPALTIQHPLLYSCKARRWWAHPTPEWLGRISFAFPAFPHSFPHTESLLSGWGPVCLYYSSSSRPFSPPSRRLWSDLSGCWYVLQHCFHRKFQILVGGRESNRTVRRWKKLAHNIGTSSRMRGGLYRSHVNKDTQKSINNLFTLYLVLALWELK